MVKKTGEIDLRIRGKLYIARNISYEECPVCGERVLSAQTSRDLFQKIKNEEFIEETIKVPVLNGTYG
jgi:YgiT-type zinc finger domain-containing protein